MPLVNILIVSGACLVFLAIALYQLNLPGLYPDEAFDVIPTMQLLLGHPVELQRNAAIHIFGLSLPLMSSSDYQGVTSTYFALPFFVVGGINVYALRIMTIFWGVLGIVLSYFLARTWFGENPARLTVLFLAVSPSWIFWSRIGVYVVSEVVPIGAGALLALTLWSRRTPLAEKNGALYSGAFLLGLGLATKLLFVWLIIAITVGAVVLWGRVAWDNRRVVLAQFRKWLVVTLAAGGAFCVGTFPFLLYNATTRGTLYVLRSNAGSTANGVNNSAILRNLWTEADALRVFLDGSYFWFQGVLGHVYFNPLTPTIFALSSVGLIVMALLARPGGATRFKLVVATSIPLILVVLGVAGATLVAATSASGTLGHAALLISVALSTLAAIWLVILALRDERTLSFAAWTLLVAGVVTGAVWWFGGAGRPEGPAPNSPLGLWPVDGAGALFWVFGGALMLLLGWDRHPAPFQRATTAALSIIGLVVAQSAVTVSGLWSTHLLLLIPLPQMIISAFIVLAVRRLLSLRRSESRATALRPSPARIIPPVVAALLVGLLVALDLGVDYSYQRDLAITGGGSTFSDAIYSLADYLEARHGEKVVAMDWGFKRPVQFLTLERVDPLEAYGYTPQATPEFRQSARELMADPNTIYLFHTPEGTAYPRYDAFSQEAAALGKKPTLVKTFYHRDGVPVYQLFEVR